MQNNTRREEEEMNVLCMGWCDGSSGERCDWRQLCDQCSV